MLVVTGDGVDINGNSILTFCIKITAIWSHLERIISVIKNITKTTRMYVFNKGAQLNSVMISGRKPTILPLLVESRSAVEGVWFGSMLEGC